MAGPQRLYFSQTFHVDYLKNNILYTFSILGKGKKTTNICRHSEKQPNTDQYVNLSSYLPK